MFHGHLVLAREKEGSITTSSTRPRATIVLGSGFKRKSEEPRISYEPVEVYCRAYSMGPKGVLKEIVQKKRGRVPFLWCVYSLVYGRAMHCGVLSFLLSSK